MASKLIPRNSKPGWEEQQQMFVDVAANTKQEILLIGDSIVSGTISIPEGVVKIF